MSKERVSKKRVASQILMTAAIISVGVGYIVAAFIENSEAAGLTLGGLLLLVLAGLGIWGMNSQEVGGRDE